MENEIQPSERTLRVLRSLKTDEISSAESVDLSSRIVVKLFFMKVFSDLYYSNRPRGGSLDDGSSMSLTDTDAMVVEKLARNIELLELDAAVFKNEQEMFDQQKNADSRHPTDELDVSDEDFFGAMLESLAKIRAETITPGEEHLARIRAKIAVALA